MSRPDDLDYEKQLRLKGLSKKELGAKEMLTGGLGSLVLLDSLKNAAFTKDKKVADVFAKSMKNFPESSFENAVDYHDILSSHAPEFTKDNPNLSAVLGVIGDMTDLISYGALKGAGKIFGKEAAKKLPFAANAVRNYADGKADEAAETLIRKFAKKKDMEYVTPKLIDYVKTNKLRGQLDDPAKLKEAIDGKFEIRNTGSMAYPNKELVKVSEGTRDKVGKEIVNTVKKADEMGAKPINRAEIYRKHTRSKISDNASDVKFEDHNIKAHNEYLVPRLKPYRKIKGIQEGPMPAKPDILPEMPFDQMNKDISDLEKKISELKFQKEAKAEANSIAEKAEKMKKADAESKIAASKAEREAAEKKAQEEATQVTADMLEREAKLAELQEKLKLKSKPPKPLNPREVPKVRKDGKPASMKRIIDTKKFNEKAAIVNKKYEEYKNLPPVKTLEDEIERLKAKVYPEPPTADDLAPPPLKPDMFDELRTSATGVEIPPRINEADGSLEAALAELSDKRAAASQARKTNAGIKIENRQKMLDYAHKANQAGPNLVTKTVDRISPLEDMWQVKTDAKKVLRDTDWEKAGDDTLQWKKQEIIDVEREINERIRDSLEKVNFREGNAKEIYDALTDDYEAQSQFMELLKDIELSDWKSAADAKTGILPTVAGGAAAAGAMHLAGGSVPLITIAGGMGTALGRKLSRILPQTKARIWDTLSKEGAGHVAAQSTLALPEKMAAQAHKTSLPPTREEESSEGVAPISSQNPQKREAPLRYEDIPDMAPEVRKQYEEMMKASPKSTGVTEAPADVKDATDIMAPTGIDQKMTEALAPQKPSIDPMFNEELLNTFLPRDSKRLLENPRALLAKVAQVAPDRVPMLKDMLEHDPEGLKDAGPMIAQMFPALFERDKYNMFDGKILDPQMQQKFLSDLYHDESMDSIQKANLMAKVKRGESIHS